MQTSTPLAGLFTVKASTKARIKDIPHVPPEQMQIDSFLGHAHREMLTSLTQKALAHSFDDSNFRTTRLPDFPFPLLQPYKLRKKNATHLSF